jgi:hypothetical protein
MSRLSDSDLVLAVEASGFFLVNRRNLVFLVGADSLISPAFVARITRQNNRVRLSGGIGLYFAEFENAWRRHARLRQATHAFTLPLILPVENFAELSENVFLLSDDVDDIKSSAQEVYELCRRLPASKTSFIEALRHGSLASKPLSDYLHVFPYHSSENVYFQKSAFFIKWLGNECPSSANHLLEALNEYQRSSLEAIQVSR